MGLRTIIGLAGRKQSGKTTAAEYLVKCGFVRQSFADPIKNMVSTLFKDLGHEERLSFLLNDGKEFLLPDICKSPRWMMQTLGTEWGRNLIDPDLWVEAARKKVLSTRDSVVFDDVRFENEATMIRNLGGLIIHIDRGDLVTDSHASEQGIRDHADDAFIDNDHSLTDFLIDVNCVVAGFVGR